MTRHFPRAESLIPGELRERLIENGRAADTEDGFDPFPVVKLFMPDAAATWLATEAVPLGSDLRLYGLVDLGLGCPDLGYAMLSSIEAMRGRLGLPVERDRCFRPEHRLSHYAVLARYAGLVIT